MLQVSVARGQRRGPGSGSAAAPWPPHALSGVGGTLAKEPPPLRTAARGCQGCHSQARREWGAEWSPAAACGSARPAPAACVPCSASLPEHGSGWRPPAGRLGAWRSPTLTRWILCHERRHAVVRKSLPTLGSHQTRSGGSVFSKMLIFTPA